MDRAQNTGSSITQYIREIMNAQLEAQRLRVRDGWQPGVSHALGELPSMGRKALAPLLRAEQDRRLAGADYGILLARAAREIEALAAQRTGVMKEILRDMAKVEFQRTAEIITINGLAAPLPKLGQQHPDPETTLRRLDHRRVVDRRVAISLAKLLDRVRAVVGLAAVPDACEQTLEGGVGDALNQWGAELEALARTVTTSVFDNTKRAATAALR